MMRDIWPNHHFGSRLQKKSHGLMGVVSVMLVWASIFVGCTTQPQDVPTLLERYRHKYNLPALAGVIVTSQGIVAIGAVGRRKYGDTMSVTLDDQFHLGSDTKSMTATLLAILVEEGKLSWGMTLDLALPELAEAMHPVYREVTLEEILAHKAGFRRDIQKTQESRPELYRLPGTLREQRWAIAKEVLQEPPEIQPGTQYQYSNLGYILAGVVAERTADASWEDLMTQRLFAPLGMSTCGFGAMDVPGKVDQPWQHWFDGSQHVPVEPGPMSDNPLLIGPAGTVHCSMSDWGKYLAAHLRGERGQDGILKAEAFKKLHITNSGENYAFGWATATLPPALDKWESGQVLRHAGSNGKNYALAWMAPARDFAVAVATNQGGNEARKASEEASDALILFYLRYANLQSKAVRQ